jgi:hypothetical protein
MGLAVLDALGQERLVAVGVSHRSYTSSQLTPTRRNASR